MNLSGSRSRGMVASALTDRLKNYQIMLTDRDDLDLTNNLETDKWLAKNRPSIIFMTAAKVGGLQLTQLNRLIFF